jgi:hypothetical protein
VTTIERVTAPDLATLLEKPDGFSGWLWQQARGAVVGQANDWCDSPACRWLVAVIPGAEFAQVDRQEVYVGLAGWESACLPTPRWLREYLRAEGRLFQRRPVTRREAQLALGEPWDEIEPDPVPVQLAEWEDWSDA